MATKKENKADVPATPEVVAVVDDKALHLQNLPSATPSYPAADSHDGVDVGDPQVLRPTELPLVIKPAKGGEWKNKEQEEYAKILNGAAYANPVRWTEVKDKEISRLVEIGKDPSRYYVYTGTTPGGDQVSYNNKLIS